MLRLVSALLLRQTEGFLTSILALMGVALRVPDHTTLCRRQGDLDIRMMRIAKPVSYPIERGA